MTKSKLDVIAEAFEVPEDSTSPQINEEELEEEVNNLINEEPIETEVMESEDE